MRENTEEDLRWLQRDPRAVRRECQGGEQHSGDFDLADGYDRADLKRNHGGHRSASRECGAGRRLMDYFSNINDATDEASRLSMKNIRSLNM